MIAVEHLTKTFGRTRAVEDVSFRVGRGEITGLLGVNGSGKTTIMRMLAGFLPATSGRIRVAGLDVQRESLGAREQLGYLPEHTALYPDMRVGQYLDFCADVRRLRGPLRRSRIAEVLRVCALTDVRRRLIGQLSKGYRQRVGLAQALLHDPPVLILDEPTVGLDPRQIVEIRTLIESLRGRTTVLLSTHSLPEVATVCDRVMIIDRGRLVAEDSAEGLARNLQSGERTLVRVDGPAAAVRTVLEGVAGVERVEIEAAGDGGQRFVVSAHGGASVRAAVATAVVTQGWGLMEIRPLPMTLEDLFMRLLDEKGAGRAA